MSIRKPIVHRRNRRALPRRLEASVPPPPPLAEPTAATYDPVEEAVVVTFSRDLTSSTPISGSGMSLRANDESLDMQALEAANFGDLDPNQARWINRINVVPDPGPDVCSYDGSVEELLDDLGRPVPPWTDFPLTVI